MQTITQAVMLAAHYHDGQTDKGGNPFVFHPLRLMLKALSEEEQVIAILHDLIEDTSITISELERRGFNSEVTAAVEALSRGEHESYDDFIRRIKKNTLARRVKILDLQDNVEMVRHKDLDAQREKQLRKYSRALDILLS
ncbi:GTP pyrophosphokinase [Paenibacillus sp. JX-17]|uniref:GTP pyrophosphokinase n=1 Tax=Paenibacillus lacisoli TaxID=3064525 RepID=A0ABT9C861_9BACL|nr:GTP pyrophosphokinase [Paenibacillus sp. JX-17]MDO7904869.1 GTP pyrophosphokinase [Paenibacillus sp. JX-17]